MKPSTRRTILVLAVVVTTQLALQDAAWAQDPFATVTAKACQAEQGLKKLAGAIGILGIVSCLMLGYFGKVNFKWLATGIGASYAVPLATGIVSFFAGGSACG